MNMIKLLADLLLFWLVVGLLGLPLACRLALERSEKIMVSVVGSLVIIYLVAGGLYLVHADTRWFWVLPVIALGNAALCRTELRVWLKDAEVRQALQSYALLVGWCLGWLGLVVSYSGGGWAGDWMEHYERVRFFLEHWPKDKLLIGLYSLPARPPLANLVTGCFQAMTKGGFASFQVFSALFASLVFWPLYLLARSWVRLPPGQMAACVALALAFNPLFIQNTAFTWTKLPAAFLILAGIYCYQEGVRRAEPRLRLLAAVTLGAAMITHYSAGPYLLALVAAHLLLHRGNWASRRFWQEALRLVAAFCALPATWLVWSLARYGMAATFGSNTTITGNSMLHVSWWGKAAGNIYNTFVPHPLAAEATGLLSQSSPWGGWRDFFFNFYQVNLPWAFGSVGFIVLLHLLIKAWVGGAPGVRGPIAGALILTVITGIVVNGDLDPLGSTHLCLQSLVLAGVAVIAANWPTLPSVWRRALACGWTFDFCTGIALHFANQGLLIDRWLHPERTARQIISTFSLVGRLNFNGKLYLHAEFMGEHFHLSPIPLLVLLAAIMAWFVNKARSSRIETGRW
jgi:hypothetical protein